MENKKTENKKNVKRIAAIAAIVLLVLMYIILFVLAIVDHTSAMRYFMIAFFCTMVIPIMLWFFRMMYKNKHPDDETDKQA